MWPAFDQALARYQELETLLGHPAVVADRARYTQCAKERVALAKKVKPYLEYRKSPERKVPHARGTASRPPCSTTPAIRVCCGHSSNRGASASSSDLC